MQLITVPIEQVKPAEDNVRQDIGDVAKLAKSIGAVGIVQPLVVRTQGDGYEVIAGHRRLAAAEKVGLTEVPIIVTDRDSDAERISAMLVENVHRDDLTETEQLQASLILIDAGMTRKDIAASRGVSQKRLRQELKALDLGENVTELINEGLLQMDQAIEIAEADLDIEEAAQLFDLLADETERGPVSDWRVSALMGQAERKAKDQRAYETITTQLHEMADAGVRVEYEVPSKGIKFLINELPKHGDERKFIVIDREAHRAEPCHAAGPYYKRDYPATGWELVEWCESPNRHRVVGKSDLKRNDAELIEEKREQAKEERQIKKIVKAVTDARIEYILTHKISDKVALDLALAKGVSGMTAQKRLQDAGIELPDGYHSVSEYAQQGRDEAKKALAADVLGSYANEGYGLTPQGREWIDGYLDAIEVSLPEEE